MKIETFKLFQHTQLYSECVLVGALNALRYLTNHKQVVDIGSNKYLEYLYRLNLVENGINILHPQVKELWLNDLNIYPKWTGSSLYNFRYPNKFPDLEKIPLPIQTTVQVPKSEEHKSGLHVVTIVDHNVECDAYQVCNFSNMTTDRGWIFVEDFYKCLPHNPYFILFDLIDNIKLT